MACNQRYLVEIKFAAKGAHKMRMKILSAICLNRKILKGQ